VHVWDWNDVETEGFVHRPALTGGHDDHPVLTEQLAGWREKYPDVTVRQAVLQGRPGRALLGYAQHAQAHPRMIVVGGSGHGGLAEYLLGTTARTLISQALYPVILVLPDTRR